MAKPPPQSSWAAAHAQRRLGGSPPAVARKEPCPGSNQNVTPLASLLLRPSLSVHLGLFLSLWPFTNTSEKNQTRTWVRGPVVMHVFHINKIVIISFSEVSIPASLSPGRSTPWATPSPLYPVNISRRYLPLPWAGDLHACRLLGLPHRSRTLIPVAQSWYCGHLKDTSPRSQTGVALSGLLILI